MLHSHLLKPPDEDISKEDKLFRKNEKQDIMFFCSLLVNSSALEIFEDVSKHFFTALLSKASGDICKQSLEISLSDAENMTKFKDSLTLEEDEEWDAGEKDEDETDTEDTGNELSDQVNNTKTQDLKLKSKKQYLIKNSSDEENLDEKKQS